MYTFWDSTVLNCWLFSLCLCTSFGTALCQIVDYLVCNNVYVLGQHCAKILIRESVSMYTFWDSTVPNCWLFSLCLCTSFGTALCQIVDYLVCNNVYVLGQHCAKILIGESVSMYTFWDSTVPNCWLFSLCLCTSLGTALCQIVDYLVCNNVYVLG